MNDLNVIRYFWKNESMPKYRAQKLEMDIRNAKAEKKRAPSKGEFDQFGVLK